MQVWQDQELRFDCSASNLQLRPGELVIDHLTDVEDTKGNNGEKGMLTLTNLRVMWVSLTRSSINLSIGFNTISSISTRKTCSKLKGVTESLHLLTKAKKQQFEYIFTNLDPNVEGHTRLFATVMAVHRSYETSKAYRELKLRSSVLVDKQLRLLPHEQLYDKIHGVWNLCSDQGTLGVLYVTNVRIVWHCSVNEIFNISLPYLQMKSVALRDSKFGMAMVVESSAESGNYVLGFRVEPLEKLKAVAQQIQTVYQVYNACPVFGVDFEFEDQAPLEMVPAPIEQPEYLEVVTHRDALASYLADPHKVSDREPVFSSELGLAVEKLPDGYTLKDLWEVS